VTPDAPPKSDSSAPSGLDDGARSKFGLDGDDDSWLAQCRRSRDGPAPVRLGSYELIAEAGRGGQRL
jgi:hypothetical protein